MIKSNQIRFCTQSFTFGKSQCGINFQDILSKSIVKPFVKKKIIRFFCEYNKVSNSVINDIKDPKTKSILLDLVRREFLNRLYKNYIYIPTLHKSYLKNLIQIQFRKFKT